MEFSQQQEEALEAVDRWFYEGDSQVFRLFGYAGTGKTTLAKQFARDGTRFAAFTGKAAHVLRQKGCDDASTLHSLIYRPIPKLGSKLRELEEQLDDMSEFDPRADGLRLAIAKERKSLKQPSFLKNEVSILEETELLVIDECSMVDDRLAEDVLSFGQKTLVLGDPAQLPPVKGEGYFTRGEPDYLLTEIHRQALGNPIISMATRVRQMRPLKIGEYGESRVIPRSEFDPDDYVPGRQIIVGKNATRRRANARARNSLGLQDPMPVAGDRLVCLRNNHDLGLMNGSIWTVLDRVDEDQDALSFDLTDETGSEQFSVDAIPEPFLGKEWSYWDKRGEVFDFGYAITAHKSQGSSWSSVVVINESGVFRADRWRWLYTSITRASEKLVVVQ